MPGGTGWGAAWGVCEEGGSVAEEGEMREAACEEGEEEEEEVAAVVGGDAGEGIVACRSPASLRPGCKSTSPARPASVRPAAWEPSRALSLIRCVTSQKKKVTRAERRPQGGPVKGRAAGTPRPGPEAPAPSPNRTARKQPRPRRRTARGETEAR